jgi:hypothetical protein
LALAFYSGLWAFDGWWVPEQLIYLLMHCVAKEGTNIEFWLKNLMKEIIWEKKCQDNIKMYHG